MKRSLMRAVFFVFVSLVITIKAALLPPKFVSSVVAIGHNERGQDGTLRWITDASGFFYGFLAINDPDSLKRQYELFVMTNRHVIENRQVISIRLNP
jgi:hypothetical protein